MSQKNILKSATEAVALHMMYRVHYNALVEEEGSERKTKYLMELSNDLYNALTSAPSEEKSRTCWSLTIDICAAFPLSTKKALGPLIEGLAAEANQLRARYPLKRGQWLNFVVNTSETGIGSWLEDSIKENQSLRELECELLYHGAVLKIFRKIEEVLAVSVRVKAITDSLQSFNLDI